MRSAANIPRPRAQDITEWHLRGDDVQLLNSGRSLRPTIRILTLGGACSQLACFQFFEIKNTHRGHPPCLVGLSSSTSQLVSA